MSLKVALQGKEGNYTHCVALKMFKNAKFLFTPCFEDAFEIVENGKANCALIPFENSTMGRVPDIYHILPKTSLKITSEYFEPISHCLLGVKGCVLSDIKTVISQMPAIMQCRENLKKMGLNYEERADTALSAKEIAESLDKSKAAIASKAAAEVYNLDVLKENLQDTSHNTTRFVVFEEKETVLPISSSESFITSILFSVRNIPSSLYKSLGGFATNNINMLKIESYISGGSFNAAQFYIEIYSHQESAEFKLALEELKFFSENVKIVGCYKADSFRSKL